MNITDALYRAAHNYQHGGIEALAGRMGISPSSLQHKVSPTYPGAHCSPGEMAQICELTGDHSALTALSSRLGYVLLKLPHFEAPEGFSSDLVNTVKEFGQFITEVSEDLADGTVTDTELRRIEREGAEALAAIHQMMSRAANMNRAAKPAALRRVEAA